MTPGPAGEYFKEPLPASTMVEIVDVSAPDFLIEISPTALTADRC